MRAVVRKQAIMLGGGMLVGILSATLGSVVQAVFHVPGFWVMTAALGAAGVLLYKMRPDFFR